MPTFAIIAEGHTDQLVIEAMLMSALGIDRDLIQFVQPDERETQVRGVASPGGWTLVLAYLRERRHLAALQLNDYVVLHIDADVCEEPGFDVPRRAEGVALDADQLAEAIQARLIQEMGETYGAVRERVVFAIAVDSVECWLLPALFPDRLALRAKTTGCLESANDELRRQGASALSRGDSKVPRAYQDACRPYRKRRDLLALKDHNPSLRRFVDAMLALDHPPPPR